MEWKDAIKTVLQDAKEPMHYTEIADQIAQRTLRAGADLGATPASTVNSILATSFKNEGDSSPFLRTSRGYYTLRSKGQQMTIGPELEAETSEATGLVNAFGMFWERSKVLWITPQPKILGQQQTGSGSVDFSEEKGVYLLHDSQGVLYVGRTTDQNLGKRLYQHTLDRLAGRWTRFSWFGVYPVEENGTLNSATPPNLDVDLVISTMEAVLIEGLEPRQNRKRGDDFQAIEFNQVEDPEVEKRRRRMLLQELSQKV